MVSSRGQQSRGAGRAELRCAAAVKAAAAGRASFVAMLAGMVLSVAGCQREDDAPSPVRMVRTITVAPPAAAVGRTFTGRIEAQDEASLSFRIGGRLAERSVGVGDTVAAGAVVARLDPENELNELRSAQAALAAAQGLLRKADNALQRQTHLFDRNVTARADFEAAEQGQRVAQAQVEAAQARVDTAQAIVGFTTLKADAPGVVTRVGAEPGEVVPAGRMIVQLARRDGRDAVFDVPADLARNLTDGERVSVTQPGEAAATPVDGRVREVSPQADPVTRTFQVRVGLTDPPPSFRLGSAAAGTISGSEAAAIAIPTAALTSSGADTGVWVVDPHSLTVSMRKIEVIGSDPATAFVGNGLSPGDLVVAAGAGALAEGQKVQLTGTEAQ